MSCLSVILLLILPYLLWSTYALLKNYVQARKLSVSIIISPINPFNPLWVLSYNYLLPYLKSLPSNIVGFILYSYGGWPYDDKYKTPEQLGPAFVVVNPGHVELYIADGEAVDDISLRRKDFDKPTVMYKPIEIFGKKVDTVIGREWQRHRKITTPPFKERNSSLVWKESIRQAQNMIKDWSAYGEHGTNTTCGDTMTLALHVLT